MTATITYIAEDKDALRFHDLGDMMLVFQRSSGITHMLADPAPAILAVLDEKKLSIDGVSAALSKEYDLAEQSDADLENIVAARVDELADLGLVKQAEASDAA